MPEASLVPTRWRVQRFASSIREEYLRGSIVEEVLDVRPATATDTLRFVQIGAIYRIGREILVDADSRTAEHYAPTIMGIGRSVAIGEEKYLTNTFSDQISTKLSKGNLSLQAIEEALAEANAGFEPSSVFIPLDFYLTLHANRPPDVRIVHPHGPKSFLVIGRRKLPVLWSNRYNPFKNVIFVDRRMGEWVVKPAEDGSRIMIDVAEYKNMRFPVAVKTVACCSIRNPDLGLIVEVPLPKSQIRNNP